MKQWPKMPCHALTVAAASRPSPMSISSWLNIDPETINAGRAAALYSPLFDDRSPEETSHFAPIRCPSARRGLRLPG